MDALGPAYAVAAFMIVKVIVLVAFGQGEAAYAVSVSTALPVATSNALGV